MIDTMAGGTETQLVKFHVEQFGHTRGKAHMQLA